MALGELVYGNVVDLRVFEVEKEQGPTGIYTLGTAGHALPFVVYRAWKVAQGTVPEEVRIFGPSGKLAYRWGPQVRRMRGMMDLTVERDVIEDAHLTESGIHLFSFVISDEILSEMEVPVYRQAPPQKLSKEVEDGLKRSDVIWIGPQNGAAGAWPNPSGSVPVWFAFRQGLLYLISQKEPGAEEQTVPGIAEAKELLVTTRRKGRDTSLDTFPASVRLLEGPEYEDAAKLLVDRRRSRPGPPADAIARWRKTCLIAELTPLVEG
ncbi:MAG: hypothetical protein M3O88_06205 [Actinomycetota bacterium]|nr:hypothetical protein [Actinomycetota bacterium]